MTVKGGVVARAFVVSPTTTTSKVPLPWHTLLLLLLRHSPHTRRLCQATTRLRNTYLCQAATSEIHTCVCITQLLLRYILELSYLFQATACASEKHEARMSTNLVNLPLRAY
jgi:hypothetical protein